jgi:hypothetical protein
MMRVTQREMAAGQAVDTVDTWWSQSGPTPGQAVSACERTQHDLRGCFTQPARLRFTQKSHGGRIRRFDDLPAGCPGAGGVVSRLTGDRRAGAEPFDQPYNLTSLIWIVG